MKKVDVLPVRIVAACGVENAESLLKKKTLQISIGREETARLKKGSFVVLDFGKEIVGGARILSYFSAPNVDVRLRFGESVSEVYAEIGEKNATNDHALRDFIAAIPQLSDNVYGGTGFRFLRLDAMGEIALKAVVAEDHRANIPIRGSFSCDDERVNTIYRVAQETLLTCVQNGYIWDGVKRDRLVWIGDLHPEMMGLLALAGERKEVENCLRISMEQTPLPEWIDGIPVYSLWWIINLHDYYMYTGKKIPARFLSYMRGVVEQVDGLIGTDGTHFPYDFLDWPTHGQEDETKGQLGVVALAMHKAARLSRAAGIHTAAEEILARLPHADVKKSEQAAALCFLSGVTGAEETKKLLIREGVDGISAFMSYYILRALTECGEGERALSFMKEYYSGMLDRGAVTFWEDFCVDWLKGSGRIDALPGRGEKDLHGDFGAFCYQGFRHSLCHGWSCGPVPFLTHVVLGVKVVESGCKTLAISPDLCGLRRAEGVFPTPLGDVHISHERAGEKIVTNVDAPEGIRIVKEGRSLIS